MKILRFIWNCLALIILIVLLAVCIVAPSCLLILVAFAAISSLENRSEKISSKKHKHKTYIMYNAQGYKFRVIT